MRSNPAQHLTYKGTTMSDDQYDKLTEKLYDAGWAPHEVHSVLWRYQQVESVERARTIWNDLSQAQRRLLVSDWCAATDNQFQDTDTFVVNDK